MNVVVVPIKALASAKSRLRAVLDDGERERLVLALAERAIRAALAAEAVDEVLVVSRDLRALALARDCEATAVLETTPIRDPRALNLALDQGRERALALGATAVAVLVADLPTIESADVQALFDVAACGPCVVLARSHDGAGLGALVEHPVVGLPFHFGDGRAFEHHLQEARSRGLRSITLDRPGLALDLDTTEDWARHRDIWGHVPPTAVARDERAHVAHS